MLVSNNKNPLIPQVPAIVVRSNRRNQHLVSDVDEGNSQDSSRSSPRQPLLARRLSCYGSDDVEPTGLTVSKFALRCSELLQHSRRINAYDRSSPEPSVSAAGRCLSRTKTASTSVE